MSIISVSVPIINDSIVEGSESFFGVVENRYYGRQHVQVDTARAKALVLIMDSNGVEGKNCNTGNLKLSGDIQELKKNQDSFSLFHSLSLLYLAT